MAPKSRRKPVHPDSEPSDRIIRNEVPYLRRLLDNIRDAVVTEDGSGRIQFANRAFHRLFGPRSIDEEPHQTEDLIHPDDLSLWREYRQRCLSSRSEAAVFECRGVRSNGTSLELETFLSPLKAGDRLIGLQAEFRDISPRRLIEKSQRAMSQRLEFFVSQMPLGCVIWDTDIAVQEWNQSAAQIFGWSHSEVVHRRYADFLVPDEDQQATDELWQRLTQGKAAHRRLCQNLTKHRGSIECEWFHTSLLGESGEVVAVASMVQDVTERKSLEQQLLQSQKMEALGTLAGGIAHDFNNLLTTIQGQISLSRMKVGPSHAASRGLQDAETAAERAAQLIQQLLSFGRKTPPQLQPVDLNQCVRDVMRLFKHGIDPQIETELDLHPALWPVEADAGQLGQVLMNLCVNARDAITGAGIIRIQSANRRARRSLSGSEDDAAYGDFVEISVTDDGCGMDHVTQSRLFEPFFTTKEVGKGTGLGLAMVYGIIKDHGGSIEVSSEPGLGSTFRVYLPRTDRAVEVERAEPELELRTDVETILIAEDDDLVRHLAQEILGSCGHTVLEARDGQEAIEVFRLRQHEIGLVILDRTMPRKSGWDAFEEIRQLDPAIPVIMTSGYSLEGGPESVKKRGAQAFLSKPFTPSRLLTAVQSTLDKRKSTSKSLPG